MQLLWLRLWTDITNDPKIRRIPPAQRWAWIAILVLSKKSPIPGMLLVSEGVPVTVADIADEARISEQEAEQAIQSFLEQNMLTAENGVYIVLHWKLRQFESDSSTERVRRLRQKRGKNVNVTETFQDSFIDVSETPPETETETEISNLSSAIRESLKLLKAVPGWKFDFSKDVDLLQDLMSDFPNVDISKELKNIKTWVADKPFKKNANRRLFVRKWISNSQKDFNQRLGRNQQSPVGAQLVVDTDDIPNMPNQSYGRGGL